MRCTRGETVRVLRVLTGWCLTLLVAGFVGAVALLAEALLELLGLLVPGVA